VVEVGKVEVEEIEEDNDNEEVDVERTVVGLKEGLNEKEGSELELGRVEEVEGKLDFIVEEAENELKLEVASMVGAVESVEVLLLMLLRGRG
jgi:hypothetical protein